MRSWIEEKALDKDVALHKSEVLLCYKCYSEKVALVALQNEVLHKVLLKKVK